MIAALSSACLLAAVQLSSPDLREFFTVPAWSPYAVESARTPGSPDMTNDTHRIDGTALAAFYAPFAAFAERVYHFNAGKRNQWSSEDYGPTSGTGFRFGLPTNAPPAFVFEPDAGRTIRSRRFVEYDNLDRLADALHSAGDLTAAFAIERPSWTNSTVRRWATSGFDRFGDRPFPSFSWTTDEPSAIATPDEWTHTCMAFDYCAPTGEIMNICWRPDTPGASVASKAWDAANFGQPPFNSLAATTSAIPVAASYTNTAHESVALIYGPLIETNIVTECASNAVYIVDSEGALTATLAAICRTAYPWPSFTNLTHDAWTNLCFLLRSDQFAGAELVTSNGMHSVWATQELYVYLAETIETPGMPIERTVRKQFVAPFFSSANLSLDDFMYQPYDMMEIVSFRWWPQTGRLEYISTLDEKPFPFHFADAWITWPATNVTVSLSGLTNDTRRLYTDRLAAVDQCLGALDRVNASVDSVSRDISQTASRILSMETDAVTVTIDWDAMTAGEEGQTLGAWHEYATNTVISLSTNRPAASAALAAVTKTSSSASASCRGSWGYQMQIDMTAFEHGSPFQLQEGTNTIFVHWPVYFEFTPSIQYAYASVEMSVGEYGNRVIIPDFVYVPSTIEVSGYASLYRNYDAAWTDLIEPTAFIPRQLDSARSGSFWNLTSHSFRQGTAANPIISPTPQTWTQDVAKRPTIRHRATSAAFGSSAACETVIGTGLEQTRKVAMDALTSAIGCHPSDVAAIIPCPPSALRSALSSIVPFPASVSVGFTENTSTNRVVKMTLYHQGGGGVGLEVNTWLYFTLADGSVIAPTDYLNLGNLSLTAEKQVQPSQAPIEALDTHGCSSAVRWSAWTRTDFKWNALRLTPTP